MSSLARVDPVQGLVLSDLHLFASRSNGNALFGRLHSRLAELKILVLNGDIFDFRWSEFPDHRATTHAALQWLSNLLQQLPACDIHFVIGNHDCLDDFTRHLPDLAGRHPTFHWHEKWLKLGEMMFLHGDAAQCPMDEDGLDRYRAIWRNDRQGGQLAARLYGCCDRLGLTLLAHRWSFPRRRTVRRLAGYLDHACPDWRRDARHCYFGHTHLPFSNELFEGVHFHNTGSAIHGMAFRPYPFKLPVGHQP
jgi:UDP-2,3-diacylglucosamine hydrolase